MRLPPEIEAEAEARRAERAEAARRLEAQRQMILSTGNRHERRKIDARNRRGR